MVDKQSPRQGSNTDSLEVVACPKCGVEVSAEAGRCPRCQTVIDPLHAKTASEQQAAELEPEGG